MAEAKTLRRKLHKLSKTLDPVILAGNLYAHEIIDDRLLEEGKNPNTPRYDRCLNQLEIVIQRVRSRPSDFEIFCKILEEESAYDNFVAELREECEALRSKLKNIKKDSNQDSGTSGDDDDDDNNNKAEDNTLSRKREGEETDQPPAAKMRHVIKSGVINGDQLLQDVAWEIRNKWEELGIALVLDYKVLQSTIGSLGTSVADHTKAFRMLQEWKQRAGEKFTYQTLAAALEQSGLNSCALKYCYDKQKQLE